MICDFCKVDTDKGGHKTSCPKWSEVSDGMTLPDQAKLIYSIGWECPRCRRVYGPLKTDCNFCNKQLLESEG